MFFSKDALIAAQVVADILLKIAIGTTLISLGGDSRQSVIASMNPKQRTKMTNAAYAPYLADLKRDTNNRQCFFAEVPHRGGNPRANAYAEYVTGSKTDFFVLSPTGAAYTYDGRTPGTNQVWETKLTQDYWAFRVRKPQDRERLLTQEIDRWNVDSRLPGLEVAAECKYLFTWAVSDQDLAKLLRNRWGSIPPIVYVPAQNL